MSGIILILLCSLLFSVNNIHAQSEKDSTRVLFIGNSYTHYHNMPKTVQEIAVTQQMKLAYTDFTPGGSRLVQHLNNPEVVQAIKRGNWDFVILQEQSSAPAYTSEQVAETVYPAASSLDSLVHVYNKNAKVIFYMTWGHKDGCLRPMENYPLINTYKGMQERLKISYLEMTYRNNAWCAPVGMAWQRVREERPDYILYWPDRTHPSPLGSYLAANVIFTTLYQKPYQTTVTNDLPAEQAEYIQQIAQRMVLENKELLNIKEK